MHCRNCPKLSENQGEDIAALKSALIANEIEINDLKRKNSRERFKQTVLSIEHQLQKGELKRQIDAKNAEIAQLKAMEQNQETSLTVDEIKKEFNERMKKLQSEFEVISTENALLKAVEQKQTEQHNAFIDEMKKQFNERMQKLQSEFEALKAENTQMKAMEQKQSEEYAVSIGNMKKQFNEQTQKLQSKIEELNKQISDASVNVGNKKTGPKRLKETIKGLDDQNIERLKKESGQKSKANVVKKTVVSESAGRNKIKAKTDENLPANSQSTVVSESAGRKKVKAKTDENLPATSQSKVPVDNGQHIVITRSMAKALSDRNK